MRTVFKCAIPVAIAVFFFGCASSGKKTPVKDTDKEATVINEMFEQVDRNAATIRENKDELVAISQRLADLESKINTNLTDQNASVMEIKENISFVNDQILRLDNSIRAQRPAQRPKAANVFKPGGFEAESSYKGALDEYYARKYESAISGFTELLTVSPNSDYADNAQYWIGECYYAIGNFTKALEAFLKVFDFPKSNKRADAHLKVGLTHIKMGNTDTAKEELSAVVQNYPDSAAAKHASDQLGKMGE